MKYQLSLFVDLVYSKSRGAIIWDGTVAAYFTKFKHVLFPITDRNPYLTDNTIQDVNFSRF